jgi:hypothetical protein
MPWCPRHFAQIPKSQREARLREFYAAKAATAETRKKYESQS